MAKTHIGILELDRETSLPNLRSTKGGVGFEGTTPKYWNGSSWSAFSGSGGGINTWDELYDNDKTLLVDESSGVTFTKTHASGDNFTLGSGASATGAMLAFSNAGSGSDIQGTSSTWSISKAGAMLIKSIAHPTTNTALTIDANGSGKVTIAATSTGNIELQRNTVLASAKTFTATGTGGSDIVTVTAGDVVLSDGSITMTDADDASSLVLTNNTITTANLIAITSTSLTTGAGLLMTANGLTEGKMVSLVTTAAGFTSGSYININDGSERFAIKADGATLINTGVNSTKALEVKGIQTSENLVTLTSSGVTADDKGIILINSSGNSASGSNQIRIAPTGTPAAGSIGIEFVGASKVMQAAYFDADPTANSVMVVNGGGALTNDNAVLFVSSDGALATGGNTLRVDVTGTPASGAVYAEFDFAGLTDTNENVGVHIDATGKKVQALKINAAPLAGSSILATSTGALAADKATAELVSNVAACNADSQVVRIQQASTTGVAQVLGLLQADVSEPFILFESTQGTGNAIDETNTTEGTAIGFLKIKVNGTARYLSYFAAPSA
jgi:hypothetical protein